MLRKLLLLVTLGSIAVPIYAATLTVIPTSDKTLFEGALTASHLIDFEGVLAGANTTNYYTASPLVYNNVVTFTQSGGVAGDLFLTISSPYPFVSGPGAAVLAIPAPSDHGHLVMTFDTAINAIAFQAKTTWAAGDFVVTIPGAGGATQTATVPQTVGGVWIGFVSDVPFQTLEISTNGGRGVMDDVRFGTYGAPEEPTAEVSTFLLIGSGLAMLRLSAKRLRFI